MENVKVNTVILDLDEYNQLKELKDAIDNGKVISTMFGLSRVNYYYPSIELVSNSIKDENKRLNDEIFELHRKIWNLEHPKDKKLDIDDIKKMSVWRFLRWRNK